MAEVWKSPRKLEEEAREAEEAIRQYRFRTFDRMIDLALDGIVTRPQAIRAYQEQIAADPALTIIETNPELENH